MKKKIILLSLLSIGLVSGFSSKQFDAGVHYFNRGDYTDAIVRFERVLKRYPTEAIVHYNLGISYFQEKQYEKAKAALLSAMGLDDRFEPFARFYIGLCHYQTGDNEKAQSELKWVAQICDNTSLGTAARKVLEIL